MRVCGWAMEEPTSGAGGTWKEGKLWKMVFAVAGIMTTLVTYSTSLATKDSKLL